MQSQFRGITAMSLTTPSPPVEWTAADLANRFGPIPLRRIRFEPPPGTATEADVVEIHAREKRLYELVDGTLVEKTVGAYESHLAVTLIVLLGGYVRNGGLGMVLGADGMYRLSPGLIRIPDVSYVGIDRLPGRQIPRDAVARLAPDLAIEIISRGNTREEMEQKLTDYFAAGVRQVWYIYHAPRREAHVYRARELHDVIAEDGELDGGEIIPGFRLPLSHLFAEPGAS